MQTNLCTTHRQRTKQEKYVCKKWKLFFFGLPLLLCINFYFIRGVAWKSFASFYLLCFFFLWRRRVVFLVFLFSLLFGIFRCSFVKQIQIIYTTRHPMTLKKFCANICVWYFLCEFYIVLVILSHTLFSLHLVWVLNDVFDAQLDCGC